MHVALLWDEAVDEGWVRLREQTSTADAVVSICNRHPDQKGETDEAYFG